MSYIDNYINGLKYRWIALEHFENLTDNQIESIADECTRMYSYLHCDHSNFYNYKKKKLLNRYINEEKDNLLLFAAALGKINKLKYLALNGLDINYKNKSNANAYLFASQYGQIEMLKYLDTTTIDKNIKDINGNNAYLYAAAHGHMDIVKYFENKFDIHNKNMFGENAYFLAAKSHNFDLLRYLESLNFNIYEKNNNGHNVYEAFEVFSRIFGNRIHKYLENKVLYKSFSKICSICYEIKDDKFITCKNNHIVHLKCQQLKNRHKCQMCSFKYLI